LWTFGWGLGFRELAVTGSVDVIDTVAVAALVIVIDAVAVIDAVDTALPRAESCVFTADAIG
jgi:hypothetical protein